MQRGIHGLAWWLREIAEKQEEERGGKQHDTTPEPTVTHKEQRKAKDNAENQLLPFVQSPPDRRQRTSKWINTLASQRYQREIERNYVSLHLI